MRLLITFAIIVGLAIAAESERPQCSMARMTGVERANAFCSSSVAPYLDPWR